MNKLNEVTRILSNLSEGIDASIYTVDNKVRDGGKVCPSINQTHIYQCIISGLSQDSQPNASGILSDAAYGETPTTAAINVLTKIESAITDGPLHISDDVTLPSDQAIKRAKQELSALSGANVAPVTAAISAQIPFVPSV